MVTNLTPLTTQSYLVSLFFLIIMFLTCHFVTFDLWPHQKFNLIQFVFGMVFQIESKMIFYWGFYSRIEY